MTSPHPAAFLGTLLQQTLRFGNPGNRRFGSLRATVARRDLIPAGSIASLLRRRGKANPELDELILSVEEAWPKLRSNSVRLHEPPEGLSVLELERASARTIFVFDRSASPLLVLKLPGDPELIDLEARALTSVADADIAPRFLGRLGEARVQEGLPGRPLRVEAVKATAAADTASTEAHRELAGGLERLAALTRSTVAPEEIDVARSSALLEHAPLEEETRRTARAALGKLGALESSIVKHGDTSAQNCLFEGERLTGLVDWATARIHGAPGYDTWNASLALFEHGLGLRKTTAAIVRSAFRSAWSTSPYFNYWRGAARRNAVAGGAPDDLLDALEIGFFVRRLEHRHAEGSRERLLTAAHMLEIVCAS